MRRMLLPFAATLVIGCGPSSPPPKAPETTGQTFAQALQIMCDVDKLGNIATDNPFEIGRLRTEVIQEKVDNPDGIYFRTMLAVKGPSEQAVELRKQAKEVGLERCVLADDLEQSGAGGIGP